MSNPTCLLESPHSTLLQPRTKSHSISIPAMLRRRRRAPIKYTERKTIKLRSLPKPINPPCGLLRVSFTDFDATDSSSDDDATGDSPPPPRLRVRKHVNEIKFQVQRQSKDQPTAGNRASTASKSRSSGNRYIGVRQRPCGRWGAKIRDPSRRARVWLRTYDSTEEAAATYERAAVKHRGPDAVTNFEKISLSTTPFCNGVVVRTVDFVADRQLPPPASLSSSSSPTSVIIFNANDFAMAYRSCGVNVNEEKLDGDDYDRQSMLHPENLMRIFDFKMPQPLNFEYSNLLENEKEQVKVDDDLSCDLFGSDLWVTD